MAIFDSLTQQEEQKKDVDLDLLKKQLSPSQLKVARQNYRIIMQDMAKYMDISCIDLQLKVSIGVIERLLAYQM